MKIQKISFELLALGCLVILSGCDRKTPQTEITKLYASGSTGAILKGYEGEGGTIFYLWEVRDEDSTGIDGGIGFFSNGVNIFKLNNTSFANRKGKYSSYVSSPFNSTCSLYLSLNTLVGQQTTITAVTTVPDSIHLIYPEWYDTVLVGNDIAVNWSQVQEAENIKVFTTNGVETNEPSYNNESSLLPGNTTSYTIPGDALTEPGYYYIIVEAYTNYDTTKPGNIKGAEGHFIGLSRVRVEIVVQ